MGRGQQQEGGQQSDVEENKKKQLEKIIRLIFDSINQGRGNTMTFSPNHPLYEPIEEIVEEYFELPNLASKIALFTQFCNRRINEEITSAIKQSKVNVEPVTKTPAPAANSTPKVDVEPVAETPAPVAPVALNTKPKRFTLTAPQKTGKTRIHTFANYPQVIPQLIGTFTVPSNKTQKVTFTKSNKQPLNKNGQKEYVSATTGTVATPGHRGGKHRTHKKCHTKKTRRTQKNHKRKKHGTQRKRSQRQRI